MYATAAEELGIRHDCARHHLEEITTDQFAMVVAGRGTSSRHVPVREVVNIHHQSREKVERDKTISQKEVGRKVRAKVKVRTVQVNIFEVKGQVFPR